MSSYKFPKAYGTPEREPRTRRLPLAAASHKPAQPYCYHPTHINASDKAAEFVRAGVEVLTRISQPQQQPGYAAGCPSAPLSSLNEIRPGLEEDCECGCFRHVYGCCPATQHAKVAEKLKVHDAGRAKAGKEVEQKKVKVQKDADVDEEWEMVSRKEATEQEKWVEVVWET
ncbi:hypothetical protein LTR78_000032 [Recurvomyces mirabilis]|uniref:Uncharacterized protein n=1 Tax=Recurvomyces mirabilis TaxID=574656 RepID=A0AAE0WWZ3_9PEZI|nr:hypothetical protein LTR78_000032 [Recurvomyces mirabilis]KAK5161689.1 hypothetical protein LTS14_000033 [Recurvomyces mirabilis]